MTKKIIIAVILSLATIFPQNTNAEELEPVAKTKLWQAKQAKSVFLVVAVVNLGEISDENNQKIGIQLEECRDISNRQSQYGLSLSILSRDRRFSYSYLDEDEIQPMLETIDYFFDFKKNIIQSEGRILRAEFVSRGGIKLSNFDLLSEEEKGFRLSCASLRTAGISSLTSEHLKEFKDLLQKSKEKIEHLKKSDPK